MVMKAYLKTLLRMLKENIARLLTITFIIMLGISFITGLDAVPPALKSAANSYFTGHSTSDIIIKSTSEYGFSEKQKEILTGQNFVENSVAFTSFDIEIEDLTTRIYYLPLKNMPLNKIDLLEGRLPENDTEILVERTSEVIVKKEIGSTISYNGQTLTVVGIAENPLLFSTVGEPSAFDDKELDLVLYFDSEVASPPFPVFTDIYVKVAGAENYSVFSKEYKNLVSEKVTLLQAAAADGDFIFLTLEQNKSAALLESYADKVQIIAYFFPAFFLVVAVLVVLATMTRFTEEERAAIGCYKTIGYSNKKIVFKYIFFIMICCIAGCLLGFIIGNLTVTPVIFQAFEMMFHIPPPPSVFYIGLGAISAGIMFAAAGAVTLAVTIKLLKEKPAQLLKPKSPKPGKKILLEKIPFIWKKLKFKYKSSFRNIFRYPGHFIMTIISVAGSCALVLAGFALFNAASVTTYDAYGMMKSLGFIAVVIIIFAALLDILVIYNLTNMNISERKKEIATLKVLGYKYTEVAGYIYREILILSLIGIAVGLPLGYLFIHIVFSFIEFGSVSDIKWYSWLATFFLSVIFTLTVDALLYRKISRSNMLESLKINE